MTATKQSQIDRIKADLLTGKAVDAVTAFNAHCITRLAAIIQRLRGQGWPIRSEQDKGNGLARYAVPEGWNPPETSNAKRKKAPAKC